EANPELADEYLENADDALRHKGYKVYSTVDKQIHESLEQVTHDSKDQLGLPREVHWKDEETDEDLSMTEYVQNGSVTLDNASGKIIAFVGGIDYQLSQVNRALDTRRQP